MNILLIETATDCCSVALASEGRVVSEVEHYPCKDLASVLTPSIRDCLEAAQLPFSALNAVAVSRGPGSYTGLRTGVATAKGLCYALDIPLIAVDTLQALAWGERSEGVQAGAYCPMLDARRNEVWAAVYDGEMRPILPAQPFLTDNNMFKNTLYELMIKYDIDITAFCGNGVKKLENGYFDEKTVKGERMTCKASDLSIWAEKALKSADFVNLAYFEPFYMKPPNITTPNNPL